MSNHAQAFWGVAAIGPDDVYTLPGLGSLESDPFESPLFDFSSVAAACSFTRESQAYTRRWPKSTML